MLRNLKLLLPLLLFFIGIWYFFLKQYDYVIRFNTPVSRGHIYQKLNSWKYKEIDAVEISARKPFVTLQQTSDSLNLDWNLKVVNDTLSQVSVGITHNKNTLKKRLQLLWGKTGFQEKTKKEIQLFKRGLEADTNLLKFSLGEKEKVPRSTCACISLKSPPQQKAKEMMTHIGYLSDYLVENNLKMSGKPRVHITNWNKKENYIQYDFCFPLADEQDLPETSLIFIKTIPGFEAVKGRYQGNYMFTHYFWPQLIEIQSKAKEIEILEIFKDNPELSGNATQWKAELYFIKK